MGSRQYQSAIHRHCAVGARDYRIEVRRINGGENIAPREIDEVLLPQPVVPAAEIIACIVAREGQPCTAEILRAFCEQHLGRYKTPKILRFMPELPRCASGEIQWLKLLDAAGNRRSRGPDHPLP